MNLLRVIPSMKPESGGICQNLRNSDSALQTLGVTSEILSFDSPQEDFLTQDACRIHAIGPARGPYGYCPNLKTWMQEHLARFDAVIIDGLWQHHSFGTIRAFLDFRKRNSGNLKMFVMPHGMLDPYFQRAKSRRLKAIRNYAFWKLIEHQVINEADGVLFTCETELKLARIPFSPYRPKMEENVGYGILNPPPASTAQMIAFYESCPAVKDKAYWLFLGRIHPKKGIDLLINAYVRLKKEHPQLPDLVVAGPGLETAFGASLINSSNLSGIHFPGMLKGAAKWGAFYNCETFVLPSHQENFGIAVVEALACAKPVLISDQVNIFKEIVEAGGGFSDEDSEAGTFRMLKRWFNLDEQERQQMQENATRVFRQEFTIERAAERLADVLRQSGELQERKKELSYGHIS